MTTNKDQQAAEFTRLLNGYSDALCKLEVANHTMLAGASAFGEILSLTAIVLDAHEALLGEILNLIPDDPTPAPEIIVYMEEDEDGELVARIVCPHPECDCDEFYEEDRSERWNEAEFDPDDLELLIRQGDGEYDTIRWSCQGCRREVEVPEFVYVDWC